MSKYTLEGLNAFAQTIHKGNKERGFWDEKRNIGEMLMLVVSELGEAMEALRKDRRADVAGYEGWLALIEPSLESAAFPEAEAFKLTMKDTFEDEIADAVIRLLDMAAGLGIDLELHIRAKLQYNDTRPYKHGKKF